MGILRITKGQKKREDLTSLVEQAIKEEYSDDFDIQWFNLLNRRLSIGSVIVGKYGNILSLYTLNKEGQCNNGFGLDDFNVVGISVPKERIGARMPMLVTPHYDESATLANRLAKRICSELENKGYTLEIREL